MEHQRIIFIISKNLNPETFKCEYHVATFAESQFNTARSPQVASGKIRFPAGKDGGYKGHWLFLWIPAEIAKLGIIKVYKNCKEMSVLWED